METNNLENQNPTQAQQSTVEQTNATDQPATQQEKSLEDWKAEAIAYKQLLEENRKTMADLNAQIAEIKVANAKLAVQTTQGIDVKEPEQILYEMFKN